MSHLYQHSAFGFLVYYMIYVIWTGTFRMPDYFVFLMLFFSMLPDLDALYYMIFKKKQATIDSKFQHHFFSWAHYPLVYTPFIFIFILSLIFNFLPLLFLIPVIGIYIGHFFLDTIACGDGVMWTKNPFNKKKYVPFVNLFSKNTDGYHGKYWDVRFRQTMAHHVENLIVIISIIIIQIFQILYSIEKYPSSSVYTFYLGCIVYLIVGLLLGIQKYPKNYYEEPPEGRFSDYRVNRAYIEGLSKKARKRHFKKYSIIMEKNGIILRHFEKE